jgi:ribosomal protein L16 Arg81 hydroxylase
MNDSSNFFLSELLVDTPVAVFFEEYWQKKPLHVDATSARFAGLFNKTAFREATRNCDSLKTSFRDVRGVSMERVCTPDQVDEAFRGGATICISGIQGDTQLNLFIDTFARQVRQGGDLSFNCYYSPDGHGFSLHLDDHPVWILQVDGRKRWWYSKRPFNKPLSTVSFPQGATIAHVPWTAPIERPDETDFSEVVLEPGDVLYLPEGTWHRAAAADGESLALTLACSRSSPMDLVQQVIAAQIAYRPALRENLPGAWAPTISETIPAGLEQQFSAVIQELRGLVNGLTPQDMYDAWKKLATKETSHR